MVYKTGEKPGKGTYLCTKCDQKVTLDDATDTLPPCPKCKNTEFLNFPAVGDDGDSQTKKMYIFWMFLLHRSPYDF